MTHIQPLQTAAAAAAAELKLLPISPPLSVVSSQMLILFLHLSNFS